MSNEVFPKLAGLKWGSTRMVQWGSTHRRTASGREFTTVHMDYPIYGYKLAYEVLRENQGNTELQNLIGFFNRHAGDGDSFLFEDDDDKAVSGQVFGLGDASTTKYQLVRTLGGFVEPVYDLSDTPVILFNGQAANLVQNSSFETLASGNRPSGWIAYNNASIAVTYTRPVGRTGGFAFGLRADATGATQFGLRGATDTTAAGLVPGGWLAGKTYTISFYAKKVGGAGWTNVLLRWNTAPATTVAVTNPNLTTSYQRYEFRITWGASVEATRGFHVDVGTAAGATGTSINDEIHVDDLQVVFASSAPAYVAGEQTYLLGSSGGVTFLTAPAAGASLSWTGGYYWRVRFKENKLEFQQFLQKLWEARQVDLVGRKP